MYTWTLVFKAALYIKIPENRVFINFSIKNMLKQLKNIVSNINCSAQGYFTTKTVVRRPVE